MADKLHIVCPQCQAVNRVEPQRLAQATCGKCRAGLTPGEPVNLDAAGLERNLTKGGLPLLVDFWAPWCGPCRSMAPAFAQAARELAPAVRLAKVNTEENQAIGARLGIQSIPTMVLFQGGREVDRVSGAMPAQNIVGWARSHLG